MAHDLLNDSQEYVEETYDQVTERYNEFGKDLYKVIKENLPFVFDQLKFYKAIGLNEKTTWGQAETENSYAIYDDGQKSFAIQLEPMTPVICLNNHKTQIEIGDWNGNDYYSESIDFIKGQLLGI